MHKLTPCDTAVAGNERQREDRAVQLQREQRTRGGAEHGTGRKAHQRAVVQSALPVLAPDATEGSRKHRRERRRDGGMRNVGCRHAERRQQQIQRRHDHERAADAQQPREKAGHEPADRTEGIDRQAGCRQHRRQGATAVRHEPQHPQAEADDQKPCRRHPRSAPPRILLDARVHLALRAGYLQGMVRSTVMARPAGGLVAVIEGVDGGSCPCGSLKVCCAFADERPWQGEEARCRNRRHLEASSRVRS